MKTMLPLLPAASAAALIPAAGGEVKPAPRGALPADLGDLLLRTEEMAAPQIMFS